MLPSRHRLRDRADFTAAIRGRRAGSPLLVVHLVAPPSRSGSPARVGLVVSKAVGNAVIRNRTKRRLRALMQRRLDRIRPGVDLVVRAGTPAGQASSTELGAELDRLLARVGACEDS